MTASTKTRRRLLDLFVIVLMPLVVVSSVWYTNSRSADAVQKATAESLLQIRQASCENSNEFRTFMSGYLRSQIGVPINDAPGFDRLDPDTRALVLALGPVLDAGRENRSQKAATYTHDFPIVDCSKVTANPADPTTTTTPGG